MRSYTDDGSHYDDQIGAEATPGEFLDALIACTADWLKVLKPTGSIWVNLGDKYAGSGGHNNAGIGGSGRGPSSYNKSTSMGPVADMQQGARDGHRRSRPFPVEGVRDKSLMGLPWRYALRCIDDLGLILRAEIIWDKPNGIPESVTDRVRRSHEHWFHFTNEGRYFAAVDEVRDPLDVDVLGALPGSVWTIPTEPLLVPDHLAVDHFAAFPSEWPRRIILGWSPSGYCTVCGEPRRPVVDKEALGRGRDTVGGPGRGTRGLPGYADVDRSAWNEGVTRRITGYSCACSSVEPTSTSPAVVLDPFVGTGTTVAVAHLLGRHGIGTDLSADYLRLAEWRCTADRPLRDKVLDRTGIPNPRPPVIDGQLSLLAE